MRSKAKKYKEIALLILLFIIVLFFKFGNKNLSADQIQLKYFKKDYHNRLSQIKVASLYENITDAEAFGTNINNIIKQFKETNTDFVFRGFWMWAPVINSPENITSELLKLAEKENINSTQISNLVREKGYYYMKLEDSIKTLKKEIPDILFCGAIPAQKVNRIEINPIKGKVLSTEDTWNMALDPQKWKVKFYGISLTKERFQKLFGLTHLWIKLHEPYKWQNVPAYFPDITNSGFQELILSWAKKQIDCGADAIWIDMLFSQANMLARITKDKNHPAVKESYESASLIVDKIHSYGRAKGRYIYVGGWAQVTLLPYPPPDFDFVTMSPEPGEIKNMEFNDKKWSKSFKIIKEKFGNIPIFVFIDWASSNKTPLGVFSQNLNKEKQRKFLEIADNYFTIKGAVFVYPIHGGWMGNKPKSISYGKFKVYDSLAPEFDTYETIKGLSNKKN